MRHPPVGLPHNFYDHRWLSALTPVLLGYLEAAGNSTSFPSIWAVDLQRGRATLDMQGPALDAQERLVVLIKFLES